MNHCVTLLYAVQSCNLKRLSAQDDLGLFHPSHCNWYFTTKGKWLSFASKSK